MSSIKMPVDAFLPVGVATLKQIERRGGGYLLFQGGTIAFQMKAKPSLWFRFWVRVFFGARWVDEK